VRLESERMAGAAVVQCLVQVFQLGREEVPVVEHRLHPAGDAGGEMGHRQIARHDNQLAIARAVTISCELHAPFGVSSMAPLSYA
jgi:hypothetical protein